MFWKYAANIQGNTHAEVGCRSVILIKLLCNFIEIALQHGCSPVNFLHIFRTPFTKNTSAWLLLKYPSCVIPLQKYHPFFWKQFWLMCSKHGLWFLDVFVTSICYDGTFIWPMITSAGITVLLTVFPCSYL